MIFSLICRMYEDRTHTCVARPIGRSGALLLHCRPLRQIFYRNDHPANYALFAFCDGHADDAGSDWMDHQIQPFCPELVNVNS